ncbi:two-component system activity regulator YycH, partial [Bartonella sp. CL63NXGY]|uniref:two-component system activity regulator YycH n=1 Tax=Bartonella sp. CL63NXGY TaxID=3243538 RepID=UPI0035D064CE
VNLVGQLRNQIRHWQLGRTSLVKSNNSDVYLSYLRQPNSIMLSYPDTVPATIFNETFSQTIDTSRVKQVDHILIPASDPHNIYLLSDHGYKVYRLRISRGVDNHYLKKVTAQTKQIKTVNVEHKIINGQTILLYPKSFNLPVFGYQVTAQNADTLSQNLISSNKRSTFTTSRNGHVTTYRDGNNKRVFYDHQNGQ